MHSGEGIVEPAGSTATSELGYVDCKAILFDLDGTLVNSYIDAEICWTSWARSVGAIDRFDFSRIFGGRRSEIVLSVLPELSPAEVAVQAERVKLAERDQTTNVTPMPGAKELLDALRPNEWAIVTSNDREVALARIHAANLPTPDVLVSSDETKRGKPDPEGLLRAAAILDVDASSALAIDDSPVGIDAACRAKMSSIGVCYIHNETALKSATFVVTNVGYLSVSTSPCGLRVTAHSIGSPRT